MEPTRAEQATLIDLLDRVLDKGLLLNADLIVSLAGVPLIAVSLRAAIASVETMSKYGMMRELIVPTQPPPEAHPELRPR
ncbi:MAG: gas vesicle protein [Nitrospirae bacterium]|nr:gas vesicle protein [Nitrospirota bacterium]